MKRVYVILIALASMLLGFALHGFYTKAMVSRACPPVQGSNGYSSLKFSTANSIIRANPGGALPKNNPCYLNVLQYGPDSMTIVQIDTVNMIHSSTIVNASGTVYTLNNPKSMIDSIPASTFVQSSYTLFDSTIYTRNGILYGYDKTGTLQSFPIGDVVSATGTGGGTVVYGVVSIEVYE